jgi:hypothetical protein
MSIIERWCFFVCVYFGSSSTVVGEQNIGVLITW